ncbi:MerR family transcriptional regulator [Oceanirhabdus sp. W0125-5]|uniref:MerR family transcriptional regulator n=1 Tax=Oceanirhabdus sp. W0125-5 TaxID=2999116 RepID=UPI0022F2B78E|nr:MerR family transcriptional regulator [Oceanirhabdus sp. W0125-5]WBW98598.1 MerR family transcriptional regulator [Oceanirhabdus sp. W0125-5]
MRNEEYFTTGEFAKLSNVSKQTLIYYDKSGVFSPIYKDEHNFRYYSLEQFEALDTLISLREIGVPLKEIKAYLSDKDMESLSELLKNKNEEIKKQINKLKHISTKIENKSLKLEKAIEQQFIQEPYFKRCDTTYILTSSVESDDYKKIMVKIIDFINYCRDKEEFDNGNPIGGIIKKEDILRGKFNKIKEIYIIIDSKTLKDNERARQEGMYACINHRGGYDTTHISYKKLIEFIEKSGYEIIGDAYENELIGYLSAQSQEEYLIELSIQVRKVIN